MTKPLYVLLRNDSPDPISLEEQDDMAFKPLKESLIKPPSLRHPNYQIPFFLCMKRKEMPLGCSLRNMGINIDPKDTTVSNLTVAWGYPLCLRAIAATALVKATEKIVGFPSNHLGASCCRSSPEFSSHPASFSQLPYFLRNPFVNCFPCNAFAL